MLLLLPLYALEIGGSAAFAALVMALRGVGVLIFDVPAGLLVGRFGDKSVLLGGFVLLATSMLGMAAATEPWQIALLAVPLGAGHAAWFLGWLTYITHSCPPELRGQATAVYFFVISLAGIGLGPTAVAACTDYLFGDPAAVRYSLLIVPTSGFAVAAACFAMARRPFVRSLEQPPGERG